MYAGRSTIERACGLHTRENAGMSSASVDTIYAVECPRFSGEGWTPQSKSGPKPRANAVGDGQQVDIPVPLNIDQESKQGRRRIVYPWGWKSTAKSGVGLGSKVRQIINNDWWWGVNIVTKYMNSRWREKLLDIYWVPVPQTDTGGRLENNKTGGITFVKELGKMTS